MTSKEFIDEICEHGDTKLIVKYQEFMAFQKVAWDTLLEFDRVCRKNRINYQLSFGSLIGAIRDGGQIPWDYDIDVLVPYEERTNLVNALSRDLDQGYYFVCSENRDDCRNNILRVTPNKYDSDHMHVDVFFLIGLPDDEHERRLFQRKIKDLSDVKYIKRISLKAAWKKSKRYVLEVLRKKMKLALADLKQNEVEYQELCQMYNIANSQYCTTADTFAADYQIPTEYIRTTCDYNILGKSILIPEMYDEFLKLIYNNYMSIPSYVNRRDEFIKFYTLIKSD
ncbi:LicD family protein [Enterococcus faecium]|uniref:LicD family protein n=1 Tax=Enterococcus faecium TaxID=1352 RepID=UPI00129CBC10|nr:LicD family protein [Enterococcus faecium]MCD5103796.1 LicD family protein [Enterococcus faecium]MDK4377292.1 LicD family protein [Enterococcus faecium]MRI45698.1 LicD family protein [Enterococcus faecium]HAR8797392.1 LicD family protein [Enterococcus faecium]